VAPRTRPKTRWAWKLLASAIFRALNTGYPDAGQIDLHEHPGGKQVGVHGVGHPPPAGEHPLPGPASAALFVSVIILLSTKATPGQVTLAASQPPGLGCHGDPGCQLAMANMPVHGRRVIQQGEHAGGQVGGRS
jgi:hypothetical protein